MSRVCWCFLVSTFSFLTPADSAALDPSGTLVLPLRSIGVSDTTAMVSRHLLEGSLRDLGVQVLTLSSEIALLVGSKACDDVACATAVGQEQQARRVVFGSLSQLGDKVIARIDVLVVGETTSVFRDQLTALSESDLDKVMRRFAEGIVAGRPNSDRASIDSVTQQEAQTPARRATRRGFGFRAGFLFPGGRSYGNANRLTAIRFPYKYETHDFMIETTTLLGLAWGDGQVDWSILDLSVSRIFGVGDVAYYLGGGVGVHAVRVEKKIWSDSGSYSHWETHDEGKTAPTIDLMAGLLALRTYDFEIVGELRYHYTFEDFKEVSGKGAHGLILSFGTSR